MGRRDWKGLSACSCIVASHVFSPCSAFTLVALVIQAHPDDADISSGGTIAKWAREGSTITYVVCTSGEAGTSKPPLPPEQLGTVWEQEEREAVAVLGVAEVVFLRYPDGGLHADHTLIGQLTELILQVRPTVVMTRDPASERNGHPDHWNAGQAALAAVLAARNQGYQQVLLFRSRDPNITFDISETLDTKLAAIERHRTQRALGEAPPTAVVRWAKETGARWGMEMAESLKLLRRQGSHDGGLSKGSGSQDPVFHHLVP